MRGLSKSTKELIQYAAGLLEQDNPQTLRQLHYAIFSRKEIPYENTQADYKRLSRATTVARRAYRAWELETGGAGTPPEYSVPPGHMLDETREPETVCVWRDAQDYEAGIGEAVAAAGGARAAVVSHAAHCSIIGQAVAGAGEADAAGERAAGGVVDGVAAGRVGEGDDARDEAGIGKLVGAAGSVV